MTIPTVQRIGDGARFTWLSERVGASVEHVRERGEDLWAELWFHGLTADDTPNGHIAGPLRVNLVSSTTRTAVLKELVHFEGVAWDTHVRQIIRDTVLLWRRGEPAVDLADVQAPTERQFLLPLLLPDQELSMFYADGGTGKSLAALAVAFACVTSMPLPGVGAVTRQVPVIYADWEANAVDHRTRLSCLARGIGLPVPRGIHYLRMEGSITREAERLHQAITDHAAGLLIIDSMGVAVDGELKEAAPVLAFFRAMRAARCTVLVIHHISKNAAAQETGRVDPYGSVFVRNSVRNAWELRSLEEGDTLKLGLYHRKANNGRLVTRPLGWAFPWDETAGETRVEGFDVRDDEALAKHQSATFAIKAYLRGCHQSVTVKEIAEATSIGEETIRKALQRGKGKVFWRDPHSGGAGRTQRWALLGETPEDPPF